MRNSTYAVITITVIDSGDSIDVEAVYEVPDGRCPIGEITADRVVKCLQILEDELRHHQNKLDVSEMN